MDNDTKLLECFYRIALALECISRHMYQINMRMKEQKEQKEETSTIKEDQ